MTASLVDLRGKTVAVVGRAASLREHGDGARIDACDVVVRVNWVHPWESAPDRIGARTDIVVHAWKFVEIGAAARRQGWIGWRKSRRTGKALAASVGRPGHTPRTGVTAIQMVLDAGASAVYVAGFDLYQSGYAVTTRPGRAVRSVRGHHDNTTDWLILRALASDPRVTFDDVLAKAVRTGFPSSAPGDAVQEAR